MSDEKIEPEVGGAVDEAPLPALDPVQERRVVWKLDLFIAPVIMLLQLISYLDRSNIGFAATQGLSKDIHLQGSQFNVAVSIFYVFYILAEFPASLLVKRLRFRRVIPAITFAWGLICMCTGFIHSYGGLITTRLLLGLAEGCLFPALSLFLLTWYQREELAVRIAFLFGSAALSGAFGGLLAYAILHMNGVAGMAGWRWLYIIEGLVTIIYAVTCYFLIPDSPETAYFFNDEDKLVMKQRAELAKSYRTMTGHPSKQDIRLALTDWKVYVSGICQLTSVTVLYGFGTFLPIIIKYGLHFSTVQAQYLTIPVYVWGTIIYFVVAIVSDRFSNRFLPLILFAPITAIGYALLLSPISPGAQYFATFLVATGCYICAGINFSWLAANSAPDGKRAASVGMQQTMAQLAGVVAGQIYQSKDSPGYTLGHAWSLGSMGVAWCGWWVFRGILKARERRKERERDSGVLDEDGDRDGIWDDRKKDFRYQM